MNAVLVVTKDKKQIGKINLGDGQIVIGRSRHCDLPLDEPLASRRHIEITSQGYSYILRDLDSRNGTVVNGKKIPGDHKLKDQDEIDIGATRLKFISDDAGNEAGDEDRTRAAGSEGKNRVESRAEKNGRDKRFHVKLRVAEGPLRGGLYSDWESPLTIGRGLENTVVLLDDAVSTRQARIVQTGDAYFLEDLESSNGTFLDGVKVQKTQLRSGQKIKVGASTMIFELTDLRKRRRNLITSLVALTVLASAALAVKYFQPPDIAGQHVTVANGYFQQGDLTNALSEFEVALKSDPNRTEAKRGIANIKNMLDARTTLANAEREAAAENYDQAKDLCYRVLRNFPNNSRALELQAVIKSIENAKIALSARNWNDAIRLLEKAQESYPKSELIRLRLDQAQKELAAEASLTRANDALQHQQPDMAQPLLQSIPTNSVYFIEARQALDGIGKWRRLQKSLADAQSSYRDGNVTDALSAIAQGLREFSDNTELLNLQNHIGGMAALMKRVDAASGETEAVSSLVDGEKACEDAVAFEKDPLNALRKRAQTTEAALGEKLVQIAQSSAARAADMLQSGDRKGALRQYDQAVKATPNDQNLATLRDKLHLEITADCRASYQKAIVYEELGQKDLARTAYQEVLNVGIPGDDYYERANRKLQTLTQ